MATIKLIYGRWHCYGPDGKNWCAFDKKEYAIEIAKAHGWAFIVE